MKFGLLLLIPASLLFPGQLLKAQKSELTEIKFPLVFIWEYTNNLLPEDQTGHKGEFWAYYNPETQYWAFMDDSLTGASGMMYDWVLMKPDGTVVLQAKPEFENEEPQQETRKIEYVKVDKIPAEMQSSGEKIKINFKNFHAELDAEEFAWQGKNFKGRGIVFLSDSKIDFTVEPEKPVEVDYTPVYNFWQLKESELEFPIEFTGDIPLPGNRLMCGLLLMTSQGSLKAELKDISWTDTYIYLKD